MLPAVAGSEQRRRLTERGSTASLVVVKKQQDLVHGCIPACALEVMSRLDPKATLPTEAELIQAMSAGTGSGFEMLQHATASLTSTFRVEVHESGPPIEDLAACANAGALPLVCIDNAKLKTGNSGPVAHCLVIESHDSQRATWTALDPWPTNPDSEAILDARFQSVWCKGFAVVSKA